MEALKAALRGPSSAQCHPISLQLMTKDTPDALSQETYGNFDSQVRKGWGTNPITDSLSYLSRRGLCFSLKTTPIPQGPSLFSWVPRIPKGPSSSILRSQLPPRS